MEHECCEVRSIAAACLNVCVAGDAVVWMDRGLEMGGFVRGRRELKQKGCLVDVDEAMR